MKTILNTHFSKLRNFSIKIFLLLFFILTSASCSKYQKETEELSNYLHAGFDKEIQNGLYITIPISSCSGCVYKIISVLEEYNKYNSNITPILIDVSKTKIRLHSKKLLSYNVLKDEKEDFYNHKISNGDYPELIEVENNKIVNIKEFNTDMHISELTFILHKYIY